MKFSTSSALLLSFLLLTSMMVEPVQSTEIRIRENKDKYDTMPVPRTLKRGGSHSSTGKGKGGSHSSTGKGKGGSHSYRTCSNKNAESCVSDPGLPDSACENSDNSDIDDTGACVGLDFNNQGVCEDMDSVTVDKYSCVDQRACYGAAFTEICGSSCQGDRACYFANSNGNAANMLTIGPGSCRSGSHACNNVQNVEKIGSGSCIFTKACANMKSLTGDRTTVGDNSCIGTHSCEDYQGTSIGDDACVGDAICEGCLVDVPAGKCNADLFTTTCVDPATADCPCAC